MKKLLFWSIGLVCLAALSSALVSCDDDNDGSGSSSSLVGYWYDRYMYEDFDGSISYDYEIAIYESDGTFRIQYWSTGDTEMDEEYGTYTYNAKTQQLTTNTLVGEKPGWYTCTARVTGQTLTILEPDGDSYSYERISYQEYKDLIDVAF